MYDWVRLSINSFVFANRIRNNPLFKDWVRYTRTRSGIKVELAEYKDLIFKLFPSGRVEITGSLHKYHNNGEHNVNDFSSYDLNAVLNDLEKKFGSEILSMKVQNLEFGLNINTLFTPSEFTDRVIVYLSKGAKLKHAITKNDAKGFDKGLKFILDNYSIKIYNKGGMYGQHGNTLRIEFKTAKMLIIKGAGIEVLSDLRKVSASEFIFNKLIRSFHNILINEVIDIKHLRQTEKIIYLECINPDFWKSLTRDKRAKRKKQFAYLVKKYSTSDFKEIVLDLLHQKNIEMVTKNIPTINILTLPCKKGYQHFNSLDTVGVC